MMLQLGTSAKKDSKSQLKIDLESNQANKEDKEENITIKTLYDEHYLFKHFYQNKRDLIQKHKKEEREELQIIQERINDNNMILRKHLFKYTMPFCHFSGSNFWLLKPTKLNRGQGIHVLNNLQMFKSLIYKYCEGFTNIQKHSQQDLSSHLQTGPSKNKMRQQTFCQTSHLNLNQLSKQTPRLRKQNEQQTKDMQVPLSPSQQSKSSQQKQNTGGKSYRRQKSENNLHKYASRNNEHSAEKQAQQSQLANEKATSLQRKNGPQVTSQERQSSTNHQQNVILQGEKGNSHANQLNHRMKHNSFIIQKYIERPLLIDQRKFDIRVWVFINYDGTAYFFKEGYLRTSSHKYTLDGENPDDIFMHLTNNSIQKYSKNYGAHEQGNILSFQEFQQYLDVNRVLFNFQKYQKFKGQEVEHYSVEKHMVPSMKKLIVRSLFATRKLMNPHKRRNCFELFGYDFMLDEDANLWLIEVNTNPSLDESNNLLTKLVPRMVDDMLKLSVDQYFSDFKVKQEELVDEQVYQETQVVEVNSEKGNQNIQTQHSSIDQKEESSEAKLEEPKKSPLQDKPSKIEVMEISDLQDTSKLTIKNQTHTQTQSITIQENDPIVKKETDQVLSKQITIQNVENEEDEIQVDETNESEQKIEDDDIEDKKQEEILIKEEKKQPKLDPCPIDGYDDDQNLWDNLFNLRVKQSRKEAKATYLQPIQLNSQFSFYIKERNVKIKKYINITSQQQQNQQQSCHHPSSTSANQAMASSISRDNLLNKVQSHKQPKTGQLKTYQNPTHTNKLVDITDKFQDEADLSDQGQSSSGEEEENTLLEQDEESI